MGYALHRNASLPPAHPCLLPHSNGSCIALAAVLASFVALYVVSRERVTPLHVAAGSLLMGTGIATMHYTGMASMRLAAMHHYERGLWLLSIFLALVISFAGFSAPLLFSGREAQLAA